MPYSETKKPGSYWSVWLIKIRGDTQMEEDRESRRRDATTKEHSWCDGRDLSVMTIALQLT